MVYSVERKCWLPHGWTHDRKERMKNKFFIGKFVPAAQIRRLRKGMGIIMSITSDILRGHTEAIILAHLLDQDSYGYQINKDIMKKTDNRCELKEATLYSAFRRLEQAGYIRTYWGDETVGARRRYYSITAEGRQAYQIYKHDWEEAKADIDRLLK